MNRASPSGVTDDLRMINNPSIGWKEFEYEFLYTPSGYTGLRDATWHRLPESAAVSHDPCMDRMGLSDRLIYLVNIQGNARFQRTAIMENHDPRQGNTILSCSHEF